MLENSDIQAMPTFQAYVGGKRFAQIIEPSPEVLRVRPTCWLLQRIALMFACASSGRRSSLRPSLGVE